MAEWLIEEGIAEHRAALIDHGQIVAARIDWPDAQGGGLVAGVVAEATLIARSKGATRGTARFASGEEALVDGLPSSAAQGAPLRLAITRSAMAERGRTKLARCRPTDRPLTPAPSLARSLARNPRSRIVRSIPGWDDLWAEAWSGEVTFAGGSLVLEPTSALTAIDIDGVLPPLQLALAAAGPLACALRRLDLGGMIAIDFPTLAAKSDRQAVDQALAAALGEWPHERLAMNGFGIVLLVARLERPSLLHRLAFDQAGAAARLLLRRAELIEQPGTLELWAPQPVRDAMADAWLTELSRRTGRPVVWRINNALALDGVFAQATAA